MPTPLTTRPSIPAVVALVIGGTMAILGAVAALSLGPSGRVSATATARTGVVVVGEGALAASTTAPRLVAASETGREVSVLRLSDADATALTDGVRHTRVTGVSVLSQALTTTEQGEKAMPQNINPDLYRHAPVTSARVEQDAVQGPGSQGLIVLAGRPGAVQESPVTVTLTWQNAAWFWQALALGLLGLSLVALGSLSWWRAWREPSDRHTAEPQEDPR